MKAILIVCQNDKMEVGPLNDEGGNVVVLNVSQFLERDHYIEGKGSDAEVKVYLQDVLMKSKDQLDQQEPQ